EGVVRLVTYAELQAMANRIANGLRDLGVAKGDTVGIFLPMAPETVAVTLACAKLGAIYLPIFSGYAAEAVATRLQGAEARGSVHVHGGFLVKIAEEVAYQADLHQEETLFWVTDLGWIMGPWEIVGAGALGATVLLFDGAPNDPPDRLWDLVERHRVNALGVS